MKPAHQGLGAEGAAVGEAHDRLVRDAQLTGSNCVLKPAPDAPVYPLNALRLLAPVPEPPSVRDFYAFEQHVRAARKLRGLEMSPTFYELPVFYFSNPAAIFGPDAVIPMAPGTQELDFELEIGLVIGRGGRNIPVERAWEHVLGLTIMNDWSARDLQRQEMKLNLGPAKGKDFATSIGPWLVTLDELRDRLEKDRHDLTMVARVNRRELSRGNVKDAYWSFPQMIAHASRGATLRPGDLIGSGTVGTGCILERRPENTGGWLKPGDEVECEIERLGILRNRIAAPDESYHLLPDPNAPDTVAD